MKNALYRDLSLDTMKIQFDSQCKRVLGNKAILAWILKYAVEEFRDFPVCEVEEYIEGIPEIGTTKVYPGETNYSRIWEAGAEDSIPGEGTIYYDIRFFVFLPRQSSRMKIIINVEAQKSFYPGYSLVTRGIFYGSRMISAQLDTEFSASQYDDIKKVYSIWICMNAPAYIGNAISEYRIQKRDTVPGIPDKRNEYDKISVVMICLNRTSQDTSVLTEMLNILLAPDLTAKQKTEILDNRFSMRMEDSFGEELELMCNLSDYVEEYGIEKGIEKGAMDKAYAAARNMYSRGFNAWETAGILEEDIERVSIWYREWTKG